MAFQSRTASAQPSAPGTQQPHAQVVELLRTDLDLSAVAAGDFYRVSGHPTEAKERSDVTASAETSTFRAARDVGNSV